MFLRKRPTSLTIVSWTFLALGTAMTLACAAVFFGHYAEFKAGLPESGVDYYLIYLNMLVLPVVYLICGVGFLKGAVWTRTTYLVMGTLPTLIDLYHRNYQHAAGACAVYLLFMFFLYRRPATAFFEQRLFA